MTYNTTLFEPNINQSSNIILPKIGFLILSTDFTFEGDFARLSYKYNSRFNAYVNRIRFANPVNEKNLKHMLKDMPEIISDILPDYPLDSIAFCCTSASALIGDEQVFAAIQKGKPGANVLTTASASVARLKKFGHKKISLLTPYTKSVSLGVADYFEANGLEIVSLTYLNIEDDRDIAQVPTDAIKEAAIAAVAPDADALFISCTALRVVEVKAELELEIGIPLFSSNHSTIWETMNSIGIGD